MRSSASSSKKLFALVLLTGLLLLFNVWLSHFISTRSGRYQFVYEEKGVTVRQEGFMELSADGHWVMDSPRFRQSGSQMRMMWTPPHGTYHIDGDTITFQEIVSPGDYRFGPGRSSPLRMGRFQGKDIHRLSWAHGIMMSESAHNPRYEKQPL